jgi:signal transduction histidine kinase/phage shock protein PspC (stress-responsive transcriptional regulator)
MAQRVRHRLRSSPELSRLRFTRSAGDRLVAGVAGGLGVRLGIDPVLVRLAFVVLAFAGGFGILAYVVAWLVSTEPSAPGGDGPQAPTHAPLSGPRQILSTGLVVTGLLLILREVGLWFGDALVGSVALAAFGSAVLWTRSDESRRARLSRFASRLPRSVVDPGQEGVSRGRLLLGGLLVAAGMVTFLQANDALRAARTVAFAVMVTVTGAALVLGPWMWRQGRALAEERRERIRSEERAEVAAHLHDSVLQTLALIQRADDPREMSALARGQERELRSWLYGRGTPSGSVLSGAVEEMASRIERLHRVTVETVQVGDAPMDDRLRALVDAAGEAASNAARHSGAPRISVYVELQPEEARVYVRDQGSGFDAAAVPPDRRGIAESIRGRMERHGGSATIVSEPDEGTEVALRMPRRPS